MKLRKRAKEMGKLKNELCDILGVDENQLKALSDYINRQIDSKLERFHGRRSFLEAILVGGAIATGLSSAIGSASGRTVITDKDLNIDNVYFYPMMHPYDVLVGKEEAGNKLRVRAYDTLGKRIGDGIAGVSASSPGEDGKVLSEAINTQVNAVVYIKTGEYYVDRPITLDTGVRLIGSGMGRHSNTEIIATFNDRPVIKTKGMPDEIKWPIDAPGKFFIGIRHLYVRSGNTGEQHRSTPVVALKTYMPTISYVTIEGNGLNQLLFISGGTDTHIEHCLLSNGLYYGILLWAVDVSVCDCEISNIAQPTPQWDSGGISARGHTDIYNCYMWNCETPCIFHGGADSVICGNRMSSSDVKGVIQIHGSGLTIVGNNIFGNNGVICNKYVVCNNIRILSNYIQANDVAICVGSFAGTCENLYILGNVVDSPTKLQILGNIDYTKFRCDIFNTFADSGLSVALGSNAYGDPTVYTPPAGFISNFNLILHITAAAGDTVYAKVTTVFENAGETAGVVKEVDNSAGTAAVSQDIALSVEDLQSLWVNNDRLLQIKVYGDSVAGSTSSAVTFDVFGSS